MTPAEFKQAVRDQIDEVIGLSLGVLDRLDNGVDPRACLASIEAIGHNAEIDAMMLARKAPGRSP